MMPNDAAAAMCEAGAATGVMHGMRVALHEALEWAYDVADVARANAAHLGDN